MTLSRRVARRAGLRRSRRSDVQEMRRRSLLAERLEERSLLAGDVNAYWNGVTPADVNADGYVTSLDALVVFNELNARGAHSLPLASDGTVTTASSSQSLYVDVNNDLNVSSIDALMVINSLNGEGQTGDVMRLQIRVVQVGGLLFEADPAVPGSTRSTGNQNTLSVGQSYDLVVTAEDLRPGNGVFAGYMDVTYDPAKIAVQATEIQVVKIAGIMNTATTDDLTDIIPGVAGNFVLSFNGETGTSPASIVMSTSLNTIAVRIQNYLNSLPSVGGIAAGNITVAVDTSDPALAQFNVRFGGKYFGTNVPGMTVASQAITGGNSPNVTLDTAIGDLASGTTDFAFKEAFRSQGVPTVVGVTGGNKIYYPNVLSAGNGQNEAQQLTFDDTTTGGTFTLSQSGNANTPVVNYDINSNNLQANIQAALDTMFGAGNATAVKVTSPPTGKVQINIVFGGSLKVQDVLQVNANGANLTGGTVQASTLFTGDPARIDDLGATGDNAAPLPGQTTTAEQAALLDTAPPRELIRARFKPTAAGIVTFGPDLTQVAAPIHSSLLYGSNVAVNISLIDPGTAVTVTISAGPYTAVNDAPAAILEGTPSTTFDVLGNDTTDPPTGQTKQIVSVTQPTAGTGSVSFTAGGNITYTPPNADFFGTATFTYTGKNNTADPGGAQPSTATVTVTVTNVNDAPTLDAISNPAAIPEGSGQQTVNLTGLSPGPGNESAQTLTVTATSSNTAIIPNPTFSSTGATTGQLTYTPVANANTVNGPVTITVTVQDNGGTANSGVDTTTRTFQVNVTAVNSGGPTAVDDLGYQGAVNTPVTISAAQGVLANDTDPDLPFDLLTAVLVSNVQSGAGSVVLNPNGGFVYTPQTGFGGDATFTYKARDSANTDSSPATVKIHVVAPPTANPDGPYSATEGTSLTVANQGTLGKGVLANDTDTENRQLTAVLVSNATSTVPGNPNPGSVALNSDGSFTYTPAGDFWTPSGTFVRFTYKANASGAESNVATASITVAEVNDAPDAVNDGPILAVKNFNDQVINVTGNDSDPDNLDGITGNEDTFKVTAVNGSTGPIGTTAGGSVRVDANGTIFYNSPPNYTGPDSFTYTLTDSRGGSDAGSTATVTLDVVDFVPKDISGKVVMGASNTPLSGVEIQLKGTSFDSTSDNNVNLSVRTGPDGTFKFEGVRPPKLLKSPPESIENFYILTEIQPKYLLDGAESPKDAQDATSTSPTRFLINDGTDFKVDPETGKVTYDTFKLKWDITDQSGPINDIKFAEIGPDFAAFNGSGFSQELDSSSGDNGWVFATGLSGSYLWGWKLPGWDNVQDLKLVLTKYFDTVDNKFKLNSIATLSGHYTDGTAFGPIQIPSTGTTGPRWRVLGIGANDEYIIRLDGTLPEFLSLAAATVPSAEGEGTADPNFAKAADAVFAGKDWA